MGYSSTIRIRTKHAKDSGTPYPPKRTMDDMDALAGGLFNVSPGVEDIEVNNFSGDTEKRVIKFWVEDKNNTEVSIRLNDDVGFIPLKPIALFSESITSLHVSSTSQNTQKLRWSYLTGPYLVEDDNEIGSIKFQAQDILGKIYEYSTNTILSVKENHALITNKGADSQVDFTLPPLEEGKYYRYKIVDVNSNGIRVLADNTSDPIVYLNKIAGVTGGSKYIRSNSIQDTIEITALDETGWIVEYLKGDWAIS